MFVGWSRIANKLKKPSALWHSPVVGVSIGSGEVSQTLKSEGECCSLTFFLLFCPGCALLLNTSKAPAVANTVMTSTAFPAPLRNSPCEASPNVLFSFAIYRDFLCVWLWFPNIGTRSVGSNHFLWWLIYKIYLCNVPVCRGRL